MSRKIKAPYFPIIYVRGYAATMSEIEQTVATPYMGFNLGSTKLRQGFDNEIHRFIFESPLLRLMKDEEYSVCYKDGDFLARDEVAAARQVDILERTIAEEGQSLLGWRDVPHDPQAIGWLASGSPVASSDVWTVCGVEGTASGETGGNSVTSAPSAAIG